MGTDYDAVIMNDSVKTLAQRADTYTLLSQIYRKEITPEMLNVILSDEILGTLETESTQLKNELTKGSPENTIEELSCEFTRIFIGPGKHLSPYESVNLPKEEGKASINQLWGKSTVDVKKFIEFQGLEFKDGYGGIPDHISIGFEFMAKLIQTEIALRDTDDEDQASLCADAQKYFFDLHIFNWVPGFCNKVIEMSEMDFYKAFADLTLDFLAIENDSLKSNFTSESVG